MIINAYAIQDRKASVFNTPFFAVSHGVACRSFSDVANDPNTTIYRHAADFALYHIGTFDDASGRLLPAELPAHVADASSFIRDYYTTPAANASAPQVKETK